MATNLIPIAPASILVDRIKLISFSSIKTYHSCGRRYQLDKYGTYNLNEEIHRKRTSPHTAFGSAFGAGLQELLVSGNLDKAIIEAIINYNYEDIEAPEVAGKSLYDCIEALRVFKLSELEELTSDWKPLTFEDGTDAREFGFIIKLNNGFYERGYIDLILINKKSGNLLVVEIKTTGSYTTNEEEYSNSPQGLLYAIIGDWLASKLGIESEISVAYIVYRTRARKFDPYMFPKSAEQRLNYLNDLILEAAILDFVEEHATKYPKSGSCFYYGRTCEYYGICDLEIKKPEDKVPLNHNQQKEFKVYVTLDQLVERQKKLIREKKAL